MPPEGLIDVGDDLDLGLASSEAFSRRLGGRRSRSRVPRRGRPRRRPQRRGCRSSSDGRPGGAGTPRSGAGRPDRRRSGERRPAPRAGRRHLFLDGDLARAAEEPRLSLEAYERSEDWAGASGVADRLVALEPDAIHHHQKRVELAFRTGERTPLLDATSRSGTRSAGPARSTRRWRCTGGSTSTTPPTAGPPPRSPSCRSRPAPARRHRCRSPPPASASPRRAAASPPARAHRRRRHPQAAAPRAAGQAVRSGLRRSRLDDLRGGGATLHPYAARPAGAAGPGRAARVQEILSSSSAG